VTVATSGAVDIGLTNCGYPAGHGASFDTRTLAAARGCFVPAPPTGSAEEFEQQLAVGGSPPPAFVDSAAKAGRGTWYVGACA
jgi:hypothetical protein